MSTKHRATPAHDRFRRSMAVLLVGWTLLGVFKWQAWLIFYVLPWMIANMAKVRANWLHHVGCDFQTPETTANNNLGIWAMELGFFVGVHAAHHAHPTMHWSLLPAAWKDEWCTRTKLGYIHHPRTKWLDEAKWFEAGEERITPV